jgi:hypothetical protein
MSFAQANTNTQTSALLRTRALHCCLAQAIPGVAIF